MLDHLGREEAAMSTDDHGDAIEPVPPIVTLGPCGTAFLAVEGSVDAALAHLFSDDHYGDATADTPVAPGLPAFDGLQVFDGAGRVLRIATQEGVPTLEVADATDRRGELCARVEESFAHVRALAFADRAALDGTDLQDASQIRPSATLATAEPATSDVYDAFLDELLWQVRTDLPMHKGSWWHNLFHR
jgi:hypothetical protein